MPEKACTVECVWRACVCECVCALCAYVRMCVREQVSEIVHELTPAELVKLLMAVWDTLIKFPPQVSLSSTPRLPPSLFKICPWHTRAFVHSLLCVRRCD